MIGDQRFRADVRSVNGAYVGTVAPGPTSTEGKGHRGRDVPSASWDKVIAPTGRIEFHFRDTYPCGYEESNVGHTLITAAGFQVSAEGEFTYRVNDEGRLVAQRACWEVDEATASAR